MKLTNKLKSFGLNLLGITIWIALLTDVYILLKYASHGFDVTDESFSLLSFSSRNQVGQSFTGATWIGGVVYDLLGHSVTALRSFKIISLLLSGILFGYALQRYLFNIKFFTTFEKYHLNLIRLSIIGAGGIVALMPVTWVPLTFNYNDINLICFLLLLSLLFLIKSLELSKLTFKIVLLFGLCVGFVCAMQTFNKFSSGIPATIIFSFLFIIWTSTSWKNYLQGCLSLLLGYVLFWTLLHVFVVDLTKMIPSSLRLIKNVSSEGYGIRVLMHMYKLNFIATFKPYEQFIIVVLLVVIVLFFFPKLTRISIISTSAYGIFFFFQTQELNYPSTVWIFSGLFPIVIGLSIFLWLQSQIGMKFNYKSVNSFKFGKINIKQILNNFKNNDLLLFSLLLFLIPFLLAFGSNNSLFISTTFAWSSWFAFLLLISGMKYAKKAFVPIVLLIIISLFFVSYIVADGFINHGFRQIASRDEQNITPKNIDRLRGLKLDTKSYNYLKALIDLRDKNLLPKNTQYLGFWDLPGEVYVLEGYSPGEPWYYRTVPERTNENLRQSCQKGELNSKKPPVILLSEPLSEPTKVVLNNCGIAWPSEYTKVGEILSPFTNLLTQMWIPNR